MRLYPKAGSWSALQRRAYDPEVQAEIAEAIQEGIIRVVPGPDGGIRIIPCGQAEEGNAVESARGVGLAKRVQTRRFSGVSG